MPIRMQNLKPPDKNTVSQPKPQPKQTRNSHGSSMTATYPLAASYRGEASPECPSGAAPPTTAETASAVEQCRTRQQPPPAAPPRAQTLRRPHGANDWANMPDTNRETFVGAHAPSTARLTPPGPSTRVPPRKPPAILKDNPLPSRPIPTDGPLSLTASMASAASELLWSAPSGLAARQTFLDACCSMISNLMENKSSPEVSVLLGDFWRSVLCGTVGLQPVERYVPEFREMLVEQALEAASSQALYDVLVGIELSVDNEDVTSEPRGVFARWCLLLLLLSVCRCGDTVGGYIRSNKDMQRGSQHK